MVLVLFSISVLVFLIFFATPGVDPAARIAGRNADQATLLAVRKDFGLDRPLPVQYGLMMKKLFVTRDLTSFVNRGAKVIPQVVEAAPVTLSLVIGAAVVWVVFSILIGLVAAVFHGTPLDALLMIVGLIGISMPVFWLGEVVNLLSQSRLHDSFVFSWVPPLGYVPLTESPVGWFKALLLPWLTLSVLYIGIYARVLRASLVESQEEDFVRTARAKGLTERRVMLRHSLRMSMVAFISLFGLDFGALVGGAALLTEVVFGLNGVGKLTYDSLQNLDLPVIMATVMYAAFFVVLVERARRPRLRLARPAGAHCLRPARTPLLEVRDLSVAFRTEEGLVRAVDGVSLSVAPGEVVGIVGESGSGKTVSMLAVMRLIRDPNAVIEGHVLPPRAGPVAAVEKRDPLGPWRRDRDGLPGSDDVAHAGLHRRLADRRAAARARAHEREACARQRAVELLAEVGISNPERRADDFPHQFSGGMRQRVMIAMALSCNPSLLIADEPTTALDVTIQAQILELMKRLQRDHGSSIVLITHDMGVVAEIAERVVVMYAGRIVEEGPRAEVFARPAAPLYLGAARVDPARGPAARRAGSPRSRAPHRHRSTSERDASFEPRCPHRFDRCATRPELRERVAAGRKDACHLDPAVRPALRQASLRGEAVREAG